MFRPAISLLLLLSFSPAAIAQPAPHRIVSMNLCTDQLLLLLVERERIASLSYFAADPAYNWLADEAAGIALNRGQAEEVLTHKPDLILTSQFSGTLAANLLERLGHPVQRLGFAATADEALAQIRQVAAITNRVQAGEQLAGNLQRDLAAHINELRPLLQGKTAVFYSSNGFSHGSGTLQHDFLVSLGLRNVAADAGMEGAAQLPLEVLLASAPDYLIANPRSALDAQLAHPLLNHPALVALQRDTRLLEIPDAAFQCAGPRLAEAYRVLAGQLADDA